MDNQPTDKALLERSLNKLADERSSLFALAGQPAGLTKAQHERLGAIEREMDECFNAVRRARAARDARRFTLEGPMRGRGVTSATPGRTTPSTSGPRPA
jgi:hypothetical protein